MASASDVTLKIHADFSPFRREVKRASRWLRWRVLLPAFVAGFVGGTTAFVLAVLAVGHA